MPSVTTKALIEIIKKFKLSDLLKEYNGDTSDVSMRGWEDKNKEDDKTA